MRLVAIPTAFAHGMPPQPAPDRIRRRLEGETMGTVWSAEFYAPPEHPVEETRHLLEAELQSLVSEMSHWDPDSDLSRFNQAPAGTIVELPQRLKHVIAGACEISRITADAFDPTLGTLVNKWGFGPPGGNTEGSLGWRNLQFDGDRITQPGGLLLDLSAVGKGFAVDELASVLDRLGVTSYLVEIGGEFRAAGVKAGGQPWWVAIERPPNEAQPGFPEMVVALCGLSIATSGDYRRYYLRDGRRHAHTIDPRHNEPVCNGIASVSVLHSQCMMADAYSTALTVLGIDEGMALARSENLAAIFVQREKHQFTYRTTPALDAMLND